MKLRIASFSLLTLLCSILALVPVAKADITLYSNGPAHKTDTYAWSIGFGIAVSDSFAIQAPSTITGFSFAAWVYPNDIPLQVDWSITSAEFGGTIYGSGTANLIVGTKLWTNFNNLALCPNGCDVDPVTVQIPGISMAVGTYWLNLTNGVTQNGGFMGWDQNGGVGCTGWNNSGSPCPSLASESAVGTIISEDPDIIGSINGTTPEPSSLVLFGSGILALASAVRRKLKVHPTTTKRSL